tara:strand:- start:1695 stop:2171 length:477 start_codon:yes stop_codon:yes gene_type:complete
MVKRNIFNILIVLSIFTIDRATKLIMIRAAETNYDLNILVTPFLNLNLIWNDGIAFGLFSFNEKVYYNLITFIIFAITLIIIFFMLRSKGLEKIGFLMIIGGSMGNLFDRLYYSSVPDFIDFHYNNFHWFIFNVADIFISLGVIVLLILEIFLKKINE